MAAMDQALEVWAEEGVWALTGMSWGVAEGSGRLKIPVVTPFDVVHATLLHVDL